VGSSRVERLLDFSGVVLVHHGGTLEYYLHKCASGLVLEYCRERVPGGTFVILEVGANLFIVVIRHHLIVKIVITTRFSRIKEVCSNFLVNQVRHHKPDDVVRTIFGTSVKKQVVVNDKS
jgi:hypothetical protein